MPTTPNYSVLRDQFSFHLKEKMLAHESLYKYCNYRIGGPADLFFDARAVEELKQVAEEAASLRLPFQVIGRGTNILFRDEGYSGLIIRNSSTCLDFISKNDTSSNKSSSSSSEHSNETFFLRAASGTLMSEFIRYVAENRALDFDAVEAFQGLPGSLGGAVYGNAGCFGKEFGELVEAVDILDLSSGKALFRTLKKNDPIDGITFSYRTSTLKEMNSSQQNQSTHVVILQIYLRLPMTQTQMVKSDILKLRASKQPPGYSCGSFFKNPPGKKSAGELIDAAGLKGLQVGGAQISNRHGNFFLNIKNASAQNIITLSEIVKKKVKEQFGIDLEEEVRIF
ncbi:UDP-N-acetylmuramate dehydrogenase [Candidatus Peregrinibacteria bacterium]|nr:UDP-N-acetylmuramate dehydrogenase [Candidatus Peregrinibacteria bacterium]